MATSSILGIERAARQAPGRDSEALGPSDSSDSGSDVAGIELQDDGDPAMPADAATREDSVHSNASHESIGPGIDSDAAGTGERRSAAGDAGREANDISPDHIEGGLPEEGDDAIDDPDDPDDSDDLGGLDAATDGSGDDDKDDDEDEEADDRPAAA